MILARFTMVGRDPIWAAAQSYVGAAAKVRGVRTYSDAAVDPLCPTYLVKYPKGASCYPKTLTGAEHRVKSPCRDLRSAPTMPCFDMSRVNIIQGTSKHVRLIRSFLYAHHWTREPVTTSLWMPIDHDYLETLTDKYAYTGDRFLAFEQQPRTRECRLVGVLAAGRVTPAAAAELDQWAASTLHPDVRNRIFFQTHLLRAPQIFKKYHTDYIYKPVYIPLLGVGSLPGCGKMIFRKFMLSDGHVRPSVTGAGNTKKIEVLVTSPDVQGRGVATALLWHALAHSSDARHPVTVIDAYSDYMNKPCVRCKMKPEWSMDYSDFVDNRGMSVFYPRRPHTKVVVYAKPLSPFGEYLTKLPPKC